MEAILLTKTVREANSWDMYPYSHSSVSHRGSIQMTATTTMMNRLLSVQRWEVTTASNTKTSSNNNSNNDRQEERLKSHHPVLI
jgi:hypothetical protein